MLSIKELVCATNGRYINGNQDLIPKEYVIDSREVDDSSFFIPIIGKNTDGHKYILDVVKKGSIGFFINSSCKDKDEIIRNSIIENNNICIIEVDDTKEALYKAGEYNRNKHIDIPVIAVTGSVGKTSTREMIASVLSTQKNVLVTKANYNSLIGTPIMALQIKDQDACVFEIGTDSFGEIEKLSNLIKPDIGVITIIGTAHIGIFGSRENIFKEKIQITSHMKNNSTLIVNADDDYLGSLESIKNINIVKFSKKDIISINQNDNISFKILVYGKEENITLNQIGMHNVKNAICAIKVAEKLGISKDNIIKGIGNYKNFSRRMEKIVLKNNITLIDDTYNASIDSMKSGLQTINNLPRKKNCNSW